MRTELPDEVKLILGPDVTAWLRELADDPQRNYDGDIRKAMRVQLKVGMIIHHNPDDPWAGVSYEDGTTRRYR